MLLLTAAAMTSPALAAQGPTAAASVNGVGVQDLLAMPAQRMSDLTLLAASGAKPAHLPQTVASAAVSVGTKHSITGDVALTVLLSDDAKSVTELIAATLNAGDDAAASTVGTIARTLPKTTKKVAKNDDITVRVVIGDDPSKGPAAEKMPTAKALATTPVVVAAAASPTAKKPVENLAEKVAATLGAKTAELSLEIEETPVGLKFKPESLIIPKAGAVATIRLKGAEERLSLFLRDEKIATLDRVTHKLKGVKAGATELYVVANGKMFIVPVKVDDGAGSKWDLQVPDALVSLSGLFGEQLQSANFQGERPAAAMQLEATNAAGEAAVGQSLQSDIAAHMRADAIDATRQISRFVATPAEFKYHAVSLQLMDERSSVAADRIYPVGSAQVRLVGTEFSARSDDTGKLTIRDMPANARFLVAIDDPSGGVRAAMAELDSKSEAGGLQRLRLMRSFSFEAYAEAAGTVQNATLGSLCASVTDLVDGQRVNASGIRIELDTTAEGPFYFNQYGFLDRALRATGADGRVCFFNVSPGPVALTAYENDATVASVPLSTFVGRHVEEDIALGNDQHLVTRLASLPTAHEQLSADPRVAGRLQSVDMIDLIALGQSNPMMQLNSGLVSTSDALLDSHGRVHAFAQAAEFEPTVYSYKAGSRASVTPLIPRGFVEDMSIYAQVSHDPSLGVVLVDYAHSQAAADQSVTMHLVDQFGQDVGDGWYFSDMPNTKAIFFNVPAGTYTLLVETKDQYWLAADTVTVYNETVSFDRLGAALSYRP